VKADAGMTTASSANALLQLAPGVRVQLAAEFPPDILDRLGGSPGDHILSQDRSRFAAQRITADSARLILQFREPVRILDAILACAAETDEAPGDLLEGAYPLIQQLRAQRLLLAPADVRPAAVEPRYAVGDSVATSAGAALIEAVISADTETEIFRVRVADDRQAALKFVPDSAAEFVRRGLATETATLRALAAQGFAHAAPMIATGRSDEPPGDLLLTQWIDGNGGYVLARDPVLDTGTRARLANRLISAYADLHALGWLHGDVHPGNVIGRDDTITLIDYGCALRMDDAAPPARAGLLTDYEPEAARALMAGLPLPAASPLGEQYCVAAIALRLLSGAPTHRLPLEADLAIAIVAEQPARRLADLGVAWPALDEVLARALSLDPAARFADMEAFADAFAAAQATGLPASPALVVHPLARDPAAALAALAAPDSALGQAGIRRGPRAPVYHGGAGLAFACLAAAEATGRADLLSSADHWAEAATAALADPEGFDARDLGVPAGDLSPTSFFHGAAGVHAVRARVRLAHGDQAGAEAATAAALLALGPAGQIPPEPKLGLDLLNGVSGQLLGLAFLADGHDRLGSSVRGLKQVLEAAAAPRAAALAAALEDWFHRPLADLPREGRYLGLAHGSGGALFSLLRSAAILPKAMTGIDILPLLDLQAAYGLTDGSGFPIERAETNSWVGWCHGSAGHVLLWTAAAQHSGRDADADRARRIADDLAARSREGGATLCCGAAGIVFALNGLEQLAGGGRDWRTGIAGALASTPDLLLPHSLWRGRPGAQLAALALEQPGSIAMPFLA